MSLPIALVRSVSLVSLGASVILAPSPASAQIGGLIKKKAGAVAGRAANKTEAKEATSTNDLSKLGSPFTAAILDRVVNSLEINAKAWAASDSLAREIEAAERPMAEFNTGKGAQEISAYQTKHAEWSTCGHNAKQAHDAANADKNEAIAKKMEAMARTDPVGTQKLAMEVTEMMMQAAAALNSGDTVGARNIQEEWYKKKGWDSFFLSEAELRKQCGNEPVAPAAALAERERLQGRIDALRARKRDAEMAAQEKARAASGMSAEEFHPMNERLERWYAIAVKGEKGERFWSDAEGKLLESRKARIERVFAMRRG